MNSSGLPCQLYLTLCYQCRGHCMPNRESRATYRVNLDGYLIRLFLDSGRGIDAAPQMDTLSIPVENDPPSSR